MPRSPGGGSELNSRLPPRTPAGLVDSPANKGFSMMNSLMVPFTTAVVAAVGAGTIAVAPVDQPPPPPVPVVRLVATTVPQPNVLESLVELDFRSINDALSES